MSDVIADLADRMIRDARVIGLQLESIRARDPGRASQLFQTLCDEIGGPAERDGAGTGLGGAGGRGDAGRNDAGRGPKLNVIDGGQEDIEGLIIAFLRDQGRPQSVAQIHDFIEETGEVDIVRASLTVRLHRMAQHGKVVNVTRGHYALPTSAAARR